MEICSWSAVVSERYVNTLHDQVPQGQNEFLSLWQDIILASHNSRQ